MALLPKDTVTQLVLAGALLLLGFGAIIVGAIEHDMRAALVGIGLLFVGSLAIGIRLYGGDDEE